MADEEGKTKEYFKKVAADQKSLLQDLFKSRNRPNPFVGPSSEMYLIAKDVMEKWRAFVR